MAYDIEELKVIGSIAKTDTSKIKLSIVQNKAKEVSFRLQKMYKKKDEVEWKYAKQGISIPMKSVSGLIKALTSAKKIDLDDL